jgi:hypothetical protein
MGWESFLKKDIRTVKRSLYDLNGTAGRRPAGAKNAAEPESGLGGDHV